MLMYITIRTYIRTLRPGFLFWEAVIDSTARLAANPNDAWHRVGEANVTCNQRRWDDFSAVVTVVREGPIDAWRLPFCTCAVGVGLQPLPHPFGRLHHQPRPGLDLVRGVGELVDLSRGKFSSRRIRCGTRPKLAHVLMRCEDDRVLAVSVRVDGVLHEQNNVTPVGRNLRPCR